MGMPSVVKSAGRILDVLECFETAKTPLGLKEIAEHFGWPVSSTATLLKSLMLRGYLGYDRFERVYMPTMRLATLGNWVGTTLFGNNTVLDLMHELQDATGETITLGAQSDLYAQHIHILPSTLAIQVVLRPGTLRPLVRSGLGALLLSVRSDDVIDFLLRRSNFEEPDRKKRVRLDDLLARVETVRAQGYVHARNTFVQGAAIIGMLLPPRQSRRVMAINVIGPVDRLDAQRDCIIDTLQTGMRRIEQEAVAFPHVKKSPATSSYLEVSSLKG
jgi:IclR family KDG regulon transcriptional repressor